jgi:TRAP-type C4-dicarboxylate transport system permease small subunit
MSSASTPEHITDSNPFYRALRMVVLALAVVAGAGLILMIIVTTADVILRSRIFNKALPGAYDLVRIIGAISLSCALPYTTAIKGHVAIEFVYLKMGRMGRLILDSLVHGGIMALFGLIGWASVQYGNSLYTKGEVSATLQLPIFWVPYVIAFSSLLVMLVTLFHLTHPGKEMIKP